jgi:hypothetical protein
MKQPNEVIYKHKLQSLFDKLNTTGKLSVAEYKYLKDLEASRCRDNYTAYCTKIFGQKVKNLEWAWFHKDIMHDVNCVINEPNYPYSRHLVTMGDQHGKSTLMGTLLASYLFGKFPNGRGLYVTYSNDRAKTPAGDIIDYIISPAYKNIFPEVKLLDEVEEIRMSKRRREKLGALKFTNANSPDDGYKGSFTACGITTGLVGNSYDWIILDDIINGIDEAVSPSIREKRWAKFVNDVLTRQQKETLIFMVGTWWHSEDPIGRLQDKLQEYKEQNKPHVPWLIKEYIALMDERKNKGKYPYDPREIGEYLWPQHKMNYYMDMQQYDPIMWSIKAQCIPLDKQGNLFKSEYFRYYDNNSVNPHEHLPTHFDKVIISVDPNRGKPDKETDDCAITIWGFANHKMYLLEFIALNKIDTTLQTTTIYQLTKKYPDYWMVIIEDSANGQSLKSELAHYHNVYNVHMFETSSFSRNEKLKGTATGKYERAFSVQSYFINGQIWLPSLSMNAAINIFVNQFTNFTGLPHSRVKDDFVDSTTQVLIVIKPFFETIPIGQLNYGIPIKSGIPLKNKTNIQFPFANAKGKINDFRIRMPALPYNRII